MRLLVYSNCPLDAALGSGKVRVRLSEGLRARGHEVRVVEPDEVELWPRLRAGKRFRLALGAKWHARRLLARESFDVVEINGGEFGWLARWLQRQPRRPLLVHRTDGCELLVPGPAVAAAAPKRAPLVSRLHGELNRAAFACVDAAVTLCELDRRHLEQALGFSPKRLRTIAPGLDDEFLAQPEPGARGPRLAFLGSWIERKGVAALVAGVAPVLAAFPALELDLLGTGRPEGELRGGWPADVRARVQVAGRLGAGELARRLAGASVFVFPTLYEGYGMATAEAMACGCAVVTTPTGFGADLHDGTEALIVPPADPAALTRAVQSLVTGGDRRWSVARAGWRRVQGHRWAETVKALETAYGHWLETGRRG